MTRSAGVALMIAAPVLWSSAGVVTRHIQEAAPVEQVFWRSLFAFLFVFAVLLFQKTSPWKAVRDAGVPGLVSGLMWAIMFTAFLFALSMTTTANALVVTMSILFLGEIAGIMGAIIAVPVVAALQIVLREVLRIRRERLQLDETEVTDLTPLTNMKKLELLQIKRTWGDPFVLVGCNASAAGPRYAWPYMTSRARSHVGHGGGDAVALSVERVG